MRRSDRPGQFPPNRPQPVRFACGCRAQPECRYAGNDDEPGRRPDLDAQGPTLMRVRSLGRWLPSRWTKRRSANSTPYLGWSAPRPGALRAMRGVVSGYTGDQGGVVSLHRARRMLLGHASRELPCLADGHRDSKDNDGVLLQGLTAAGGLGPVHRHRVGVSADDIARVTIPAAVHQLVEGGRFPITALLVPDGYHDPSM